MDDAREPLTPERAKAMLSVSVDDDGRRTVHTFVQPAGGVLLGADWDESDAHAAIDEGAPEKAGRAAAGMGHGLVVIGPSGRAVFFSTVEVSRG